MEINWLEQVGRVVVIVLEGTSDDGCESVHSQYMAVVISGVTVINNISEIWFLPIKIRGKRVASKIEKFSVSSADNIVHVFVDIETDKGKILDFFIKGELFAIY